MKRTLILALALAFAPAAEAQLYKYTDQGRQDRLYRPAAADVGHQSVNVAPERGPTDQVGGRAGQGAREGPQGGRRRRQEGGRGRGARRRRPRQRCNAAKQNYQIFADGGRIQKLNAQGERELHDRRGDRGQAREQPPRDGRGVQEVLIPGRRTALWLALAALPFPSRGARFRPGRGHLRRSGEKLDARIPLRAREGEWFHATCLALTPRGDRRDCRRLPTASLSVERRRTSANLRVRTAEPVNDPAFAFGVTSTCAGGSRPGRRRARHRAARPPARGPREAPTPAPTPPPRAAAARPRARPTAPRPAAATPRRDAAGARARSAATAAAPRRTAPKPASPAPAAAAPRRLRAATSCCASLRRTSTWGARANSTTSRARGCASACACSTATTRLPRCSRCETTCAGSRRGSRSCSSSSPRCRIVRQPRDAPLPKEAAKPRGRNARPRSRTVPTSAAPAPKRRGPGAAPKVEVPRAAPRRRSSRTRSCRRRQPRRQRRRRPAASPLRRRSSPCSSAAQSFERARSSGWAIAILVLFVLLGAWVWSRWRNPPRARPTTMAETFGPGHGD